MQFTMTGLESPRYIFAFGYLYFIVKMFSGHELRQQFFTQGTAEVVFARHSDALKAINRYNDLLLDGRPIKIEIIGGDFVAYAVPPSSEGDLGYQSGAFRRYVTCLHVFCIACLHEHVLLFCFGIWQSICSAVPPLYQFA